jgi:peroxiredoxin
MSKAARSVLRSGWYRASALVLLIALAGCSAATGAAGDTGFVAGSGAVTLMSPMNRGEPVQLRGPLVGGGEFDLADQRGKVVLINIWGSWCAPCRKEAPELQQAWTELKDRGVQFLGLNTRDDSAGAATAFERRFGITYPSISDPDGRLQLTFRETLPPTAIPSTLVLDRAGRVAARVIGATTQTTFTAMITDLLKET